LEIAVPALPSTSDAEYWNANNAANNGWPMGASHDPKYRVGRTLSGGLTKYFLFLENGALNSKGCVSITIQGPAVCPQQSDSCVIQMATLLMISDAPRLRTRKTQEKAEATR
jgi:hypothetical protein